VALAEIHIGLPYQTTIMSLEDIQTDLSGLQNQLTDHETRITTLEALIAALGSNFRAGTEEVTSGIHTVTFPEVSTTDYMPFAIVLTAEGNMSVPVLQIPPLTDSRETTSFDLDIQEDGTLYWVILMGSPSRRGYLIVTEPGIKTISFAEVTTADYIPIVYELTEEGNISFPVPQLPPLTDSRSTTSFQVDVQEPGVVWWEF